MVTIKLQGGLCNQMFMIAFLISYAKKHGLEYYIPTWVINPHIPEQKNSYRFDGIRYETIAPPSNIPTVIKEKSFAFDEYPKVDDAYFEGYFQSHKYFDEIEMQKLFNFPWSDVVDTCAIQVRRGDYVKWSEYHPPVTKEYITLAMDFMNAFFGINKFKFFSDDLQWCYDNFSNQFGNYVISYSVEPNELKDLALLSNHKFLIGSNSTFSLWGHYLNRNQDKFAIFPDKWFGPKLPHNTEDLYPPKSITL